MQLIWTILIGFFIGLAARFLMPGRDPAGYIVTTILGILGSFVASYGGRAMGLYNENEPAGLLMSVLGATLVLFVYKKFSKKTIA